MNRNMSDTASLLMISKGRSRKENASAKCKEENSVGLKNRGIEGEFGKFTKKLIACEGRKEQMECKCNSKSFGGDLHS